MSHIEDDMERAIREEMEKLNLTSNSDASEETISDETFESELETEKEPVKVTSTNVIPSEKEISKLENVCLHILLVQNAEDSDPVFMSNGEDKIYLNNPFSKYKDDESNRYFGYFQKFIKPAVKNLDTIFNSIGSITVLGNKSETEDKFQTIASTILSNIDKFFPAVDQISFDPTIDIADTNVMQQVTFNLNIAYRADSATFDNIAFVDTLASILEKSKIKLRISFAIPLDKVVPDMTRFAGYETSCSYQTTRLPSLKKQRLALLGNLNKDEVKPHIIFSKEV